MKFTFDDLKWCVMCVSDFQSNVAVGEFRMTQDSFIGLTCTWYDLGISPNGGHLFVCSTSNNTLGTKEKVLLRHF